MGSLRKFSADHLFTGQEMLGNDRVLMLNEHDEVEAIVGKDEAGADVEELNGILCPGFVNAHCHLELSHMKGKIPAGSGMVDFLFNVMNTRAETDEVKQQAMKDAETEMLQNGIVAVGDICNTADSFPLKSSSGLYYHNFIEVAGFVPATAASRLETAKKVYEQSLALPGGHSLAPHAPYSVSPELFGLIFSLRPAVTTLHNQESEAETEFFVSKSGPLLKIYEQLGIDLSFFHATGKSSLRSVADHFKNIGSLLLVHNCFTSEEDIEALENEVVNTLISFCICPNANRYIGNPLPNIELLMQSGMNICLGTDSLASNNQLSIWEELQTIRKHFPHISLEKLLQWATVNGAKALKIDNRFGGFRKGMMPGVLLIGEQKAERLL